MFKTYGLNHTNGPKLSQHQPTSKGRRPNCCATFLHGFPVHHTLWQWGNSRRRVIKLVHTIRTFADLEVFCDGGHDHQLWTFTTG